jgi:aspartate oxidase
MRQESRGLHYNLDFPEALEQQRFPSILRRN